MENPASLLRARDLLARGSAQPASRPGDPLFGAMLEAAFLLASADGQLSPEELGELASMVSSMTGESVSPAALADSFADYSAQLERSGRAARIEALAASCPSPEVRRQVISFAVLVALCDRDLAPSELFVLHSLGKAFGLAAPEINDTIRSLKGELGM